MGASHTVAHASRRPLRGLLSMRWLVACAKRNARRLPGVLRKSKAAASAAAAGPRHVLRHIGLLVRRRIIFGSGGTAILQKSDAAQTGLVVTALLAATVAIVLGVAIAVGL